MDFASRKSTILTICTVLLVLCSSLPALSQQSMRFKGFSIEQGLSQSTVETIVQDRTGYIWIGTEDGLNRYDGYEFRVFRNDPDDPGSISNNNIWCLFVDRDGCLWAGTYSTGLNKYDHDTGTFARYLHDPGDSNSISNNYIRSITQDDSGNMWIGTRFGGLNLLEPGSGKFRRFSHDKDSGNSIASNNIRFVLPDSGGVLWIATNRGLDRFDTKNNGIFTHHRSGDPGSSSLVHDSVRHILRDHLGKLWLSTYRGLSCLDPQSGQFVNYMHDENDPGSISSNDLRKAFEDRRGQLYIGTTRNGLCLFDRNAQSFTTYSTDPTDPRSLSSNSVRFIFEDRSGLLWLGHNGKGLSIHDPGTARFRHYLHDSNDPNSLSDRIVWSISSGPDGDIWFGTNIGDLNRYDRRADRYRLYSHIPEKRSDGSKGYIRHLLWDDEGMLWLTSSRKGVYHYDPGDESYILLEHDPDDPNSLSDDEIRVTYQDLDGEIWFCTRMEGIDHYDPSTGTFTNFRFQPGDSASISSNQTITIMQDSRRTFWLGTSDGLNRVTFSINKNDPSKAPVSITDIRRYYHEPADHRSLSNDYILTIHEARNGDLWFGTMQGLSRLREKDRDQPIFKRYFMKDGLPNDVIYGILEDDGGCLWLSTNYGISRFDPEDETFRNYDTRDGLHGNEFNTGVFCRTSDGTFIFGGVDGATEFHPDSLRDSGFNPPVVLTGFNIFDKPAILERSISSMEEIILSHKDNFFSFEFTSLDFSKPGRNLYEYMLEGLDRDWTHAGHRRFAGYTRVPAGKYVFRVRGTNGDGVWSDEVASVRIIITPPFWRTWWFMTLAILTATALITGIVIYRVRQLLAIERLRSKIAADLHDDIGAGLTEISIMGEVITRKLPSDSKDLVTSEIERIGTTSRHLIDSMSDIVWLVNPRRDSLYDLISRLGDSFKETIHATDIHFNTQNLESLKNVRLNMEYRQNLFLIFKEALNNSLKYSGAKEISLKVELSGKNLVMQLVDDGNGFVIEEARVGNGLQNMKERAERIKGALTVGSSPGEGTSVIFKGHIS